MSKSYINLVSTFESHLPDEKITKIKLSKKVTVLSVFLKGLLEQFKDCNEPFPVQGTVEVIETAVELMENYYEKMSEGFEKLGLSPDINLDDLFEVLAIYYNNIIFCKTNKENITFEDGERKVPYDENEKSFVAAAKKYHQKRNPTGTEGVFGDIDTFANEILKAYNLFNNNDSRLCKEMKAMKAAESVEEQKKVDCLANKSEYYRLLSDTISFLHYIDAVIPRVYLNKQCSCIFMFRTPCEIRTSTCETKLMQIILETEIQKDAIIKMIEEFVSDMNEEMKKYTEENELEMLAEQETDYGKYIVHFLDCEEPEDYTSDVWKVEFRGYGKRTFREKSHYDYLLSLFEKWSEEKSVKEAKWVGFREDEDPFLIKQWYYPYFSEEYQKKLAEVEDS